MLSGLRLMTALHYCNKNSTTCSDSSEGFLRNSFGSHHGEIIRTVGTKYKQCLRDLFTLAGNRTIYQLLHFLFRMTRMFLPNIKKQHNIFYVDQWVTLRVRHFHLSQTNADRMRLLSRVKKSALSSTRSSIIYLKCFIVIDSFCT